jgi:hypothetical protein
MLEGLTKRFGGLGAVRDLRLTILRRFVIQRQCVNSGSERLGP